MTPVSIPGRVPKKRSEDGYRYLRQGETANGPVWRGYERRNGRIVLAKVFKDEAAAYEFLGCEPPKRRTF